MKYLIILIMTFISLSALASTITPAINIANLPDDSSGAAINAHAGSILYYKGDYFWYGEFKSKTAASRYGFSVYQSKDLSSWSYKGLALKVIMNPSSDISPGSIMERPKVLYNAKNNNFILLFHLEKRGQGYKSALVGVAISKKPTGPFVYYKSFRLNAKTLPLKTKDINSLPKAGNFIRDFSSGQMSRDMSAFMDDDKKAYLISSSEGNSTLIITKLNSDYTDIEPDFVRVDPGGYNEAPVMFKHNGRYFIITSGSSGWRPNQARLFTSSSIFGDWKYLGTPVRSDHLEDVKTTFGGQGAFYFKYGNQDIFSLDIWNDKNLATSKYLWIPIQWDNSGNPFLEINK